MADRIPFWLRAAFFAALGFVIAAILPGWAWITFTVIVVVTYWTAMWRRNRHRAGAPSSPFTPRADR